jgi:protein-S-isoprenylcysteine O-methyltransferase Ste14
MATPPYVLTGPNIPFWVLFGLFALGEWATQLRSRLNQNGTRTDRGGVVMVNVCVVGGQILGFGLAWWHRAEFAVGVWPLFGVGLVLMTIGIFVRQWSIITLGRLFTVDVRVHSAQSVVDRGPYRWVRHPSYAGLIIFNAGLGLALSNWAALAMVLVLPTIGLVTRIRSEERALFAQLGDEYRRFADTRRRLVPGVW